MIGEAAEVAAELSAQLRVSYWCCYLRRADFRSDEAEVACCWVVSQLLAGLAEALDDPAVRAAPAAMAAASAVDGAAEPSLPVGVLVESLELRAR